MIKVFWLEVVSSEFQVNVHVALWIDEVLYGIIWQKYPLSVGLSQHDTAISTGRCITLCRISSNFFSPPPEISMTQRASFPHRIDAPAPECIDFENLTYLTIMNAVYIIKIRKIGITPVLFELAHCIVWYVAFCCYETTCPWTTVPLTISQKNINSAVPCCA